MTQDAHRRFGRDSTTADVLAGIALGGRVVLVTGASGGLGAEAARALAEKGATVTLAVRDVDKGREVAESIRAAHAGADVDVMALDLTSPVSIRRFAAEFLARRPKLHVLVNNAGVMACPLARTAEGWELQFATNHLGHFLLTGLLLPALRAGAPARVVSVSSRGHRFSPVVFDDIHFERRPYDKWQAYGQSKTANILFAVELDRRLVGAGVRATALHPGAILTELARHLSQDDIAELMARTPGGQGLQWKTVPAGAATTVWAATAPELADRGGLYLEDCQIAAPTEGEGQLTGYERYAVDPIAARRLWSVSEGMVGETF
jgi:NAD(P)-dependent dehydrogenase (short-subunit alcohol dehydrogenase family)